MAPSASAASPPRRPRTPDSEPFSSRSGTRGRAPSGGERSAGALPVFAAGVIVILALIALRLAGSLKESLEGEIATRLSVASDLATDVLVREANRVLDPRDPEVVVQLERIRRSTAVSAIALYDAKGGYLGGAAPAGQTSTAIPHHIRLGTPSKERGTRVPERDAAGGLTLISPLGPEAHAGAILARVDREGQGSLPAVDFFFDLAKALAGVVGAAGVLILLRLLLRGDLEKPARKPLPVAGSDVDVVLGTMKEVMSTLKDSETHYRDRSRAAEADAERAQRTNALILESIGSGLVAFDETGRVTLFNPAAERILGRSARTARGRPVEEAFDPGDRLSALAATLETQASPTRREEIARTGPDGEPRWIVVRASRLRAADGEARGGILLFDDVTETKRLRDAIRLKDRLSAVGEMSAGIAHEIKNSLHSLLGHANLLEDDASTAPPLPVQGILAEVRSLEELVKGVLELSRPLRLVRTPVDLNALLRGTEAATGEAARASKVVVKLELDESIPPVAADADSVKRVFLNCALNAIEAMENGGTLTITSLPAEIVADEASGERVGAVRVGFRDTGPGIREEDRERIFTPFFTTKREGHGLGLSLVHRAVTDHGGRMQLHSRERVGTEFVILLPVEAKS